MHADPGAVRSTRALRVSQRHLGGDVVHRDRVGRHNPARLPDQYPRVLSRTVAPPRTARMRLAVGSCRNWPNPRYVLA